MISPESRNSYLVHSSKCYRSLPFLDLQAGLKLPFDLKRCDDKRVIAENSVYGESPYFCDEGRVVEDVPLILLYLDQKYFGTQYRKLAAKELSQLFDNWYLLDNFIYPALAEMVGERCRPKNKNVGGKEDLTNWLQQVKATLDLSNILLAFTAISLVSVLEYFSKYSSLSWLESEFNWAREMRTLINDLYARCH